MQLSMKIDQALRSVRDSIKVPMMMMFFLIPLVRLSNSSENVLPGDTTAHAKFKRPKYEIVVLATSHCVYA